MHVLWISWDTSSQPAPQLVCEAYIFLGFGDHRWNHIWRQDHLFRVAFIFGQRGTCWHNIHPTVFISRHDRVTLAVIFVSSLCTSPSSLIRAWATGNTPSCQKGAPYRMNFVLLCAKKVRHTKWIWCLKFVLSAVSSLSGHEQWGTHRHAKHVRHIGWDILKILFLQIANHSILFFLF